MRLSRVLVPIGILSIAAVVVIACSDDDSTGGTGSPSGPTIDGSAGTGDSSLPTPTNDTGAPSTDAGTDTGTPDTGTPVDAGKIIPNGMLDPIPYLSKADNPFNGVSFATYYHFEDWETGAQTVPGVDAGSGYVVTNIIQVDSIDGDDGVIDGKCLKDGGASCHSAYGGGTLDFVFDETVLGALPTHVGIAWTDGAPQCDAIFEAYDATMTLIGSKTAPMIGDNSNDGTTAEDRFFGVVAAGGVKKIIVKSSAGGVEVDHLTFGR